MYRTPPSWCGEGLKFQKKVLLGIKLNVKICTKINSQTANPWAGDGGLGVSTQNFVCYKLHEISTSTQENHDFFWKFIPLLPPTQGVGVPYMIFLCRPAWIYHAIPTKNLCYLIPTSISMGVKGWKCDFLYMYGHVILFLPEGYFTKVTL